jgi:hypothetical protein
MIFLLSFLNGSITFVLPFYASGIWDVHGQGEQPKLRLPDLSLQHPCAADFVNTLLSE